MINDIQMASIKHSVRSAWCLPLTSKCHANDSPSTVNRMPILTNRKIESCLFVSRIPLAGTNWNPLKLLRIMVIIPWCVYDSCFTAFAQGCVCWYCVFCLFNMTTRILVSLFHAACRAKYAAKPENALNHCQNRMGFKSTAEIEFLAFFSVLFLFSSQTIFSLSTFFVFFAFFRRFSLFSHPFVYDSAAVIFGDSPSGEAKRIN